MSYIICCFFCGLLHDYFLNIIIGVGSSLIAAFLFLRYTKSKDKEAEKKKYAAAAGIYVGYEIKGDIVNKERPLSNTEIKYLSGNVLSLHLKEINDPHEWEGLISMQSNNYGTIVWRYVVLHGKPVPIEEHRFGLKQFVFFPFGEEKVAYLMGDHKAGYFNEILIEK